MTAFLQYLDIVVIIALLSAGVVTIILLWRKGGW